jgi:hypothetical protein
MGQTILLPKRPDVLYVGGGKFKKLDQSPAESEPTPEPAPAPSMPEPATVTQPVTRQTVNDSWTRRCNNLEIFLFGNLTGVR